LIVPAVSVSFALSISAAEAFCGPSFNLLGSSPVSCLSLSASKMSGKEGVKKRVVILGAGLHGVSTAYHLAKKGGNSLDITVVERSGVAAAASGKAGGFLARDWGSGPTDALHKISFRMHAELAKELNIESFRPIQTLSVSGGRKGKNAAPWLNGKASSTHMDSNTAQVTPLEVATKMMEAAQKMGTKMKIGEAEGLVRGDDGSVQGVVLRNEADPVPCDCLVVAMGPWSGPLGEDWFDIPVPMEGIKSTSIVYHENEAVRQNPFALFCQEDSNGCHLEVYPRPNGDVYVCGCGGSDYVSGDRLRRGGDCADPEKIQANPQRVKAASASLRAMAPDVARGEPDVAQACMRPCPPDGLPIMGSVPGTQGTAFLNCGHNCWGILWGPVSGLLMSELILEGRCSTCSISAFSPERFGGQRKGTRGRKKGQEPVGEQW